MKVRNLLVASLVLTACLTWTGASPARACSCVPSPREELYIFDGTAQAPGARAATGEIYEFTATSEIQRAVPDTVRVAVSVGDSGNCGFPAAPKPKSRYRVAAYLSRDAAGDPLLYANTCGGSLNEVASPQPPQPPDSAASGRNAVPAAATVVAGIGLFLSAFVLRRRPRRTR